MRTYCSGLLIVVLALYGAGCGHKKQSGAFRAIPVKRGDLQVTVLATGNVQPHDELAIFPAISGRIENILCQEGELVKKGQKLMDLSSTERATVLDEAAAQGAAQLKHWQKYYEETPLLSPEDGQIIYLPTVPGEIISTGVTIMVMSDHLMVNTQVDETDLAQVKLGQKATITLDAYPDKPFIGTVKRISYFSVMVNNVTTYEVDVWPDQIPPFMRTGMTSNVVFNVSEKDDVLVIPADALQQVNGQTGVMLAGEKGGKPQFTVIQTGVTDGKKVEVVSGLAEGDKVLIKSFSASQYTPQGASNNPLMPGAGPGGNRGGGGGGH